MLTPMKRAGGLPADRELRMADFDSGEAQGIVEALRERGKT